MKKRYKEFFGNNSLLLSEEINKWLDENSNIEIVNIQYSSMPLDKGIIKTVAFIEYILLEQELIDVDSFEEEKHINESPRPRSKEDLFKQL